jgi:hypothetical protein
LANGGSVGDYLKDPNFRREYLGHWILDLGTLVYKFDMVKNLLNHTIPEEQKIINDLLAGPSIIGNKYYYLGGCDLGYVDDTAFSVVAYKPYDNHLYFVESFKHQHLLPDQIAAYWEDLVKRYNIQRILVDSASGGKTTAEVLRQRYNLPIFAAAKMEKQSYVAKMNSDFTCQLIKLIPQTNLAYIKELQGLLLDQQALRRGEWKELASCPNHLCDSGLYSYKDTLHFHADALPEVKAMDLFDIIMAKQRGQVSEGADLYNRQYDLRDKNKQQDVAVKQIFKDRFKF